MVATVIVPALAFADADGRPDARLTSRYAAAACRTWTDRFLLSGSTISGDRLSVEQRGAVLDQWLEFAPPRRLIACCWEPGDVEAALRRGIQPMWVLRCHATSGEVITALGQLPGNSLIYSHPQYTTSTFDAALAADARRSGVLPAGGKIAKISPRELTSLTEACGADFAIWDGSSRHISESLLAGAAGVVATPLSFFPEPFPARTVDAIQDTVDKVQRQLDALPSRPQRSELLVQLARMRLS